MPVQDKAMLKQVKEMLDELKSTNKEQYEIIVELLLMVYREYNSGQKINIEKKLYDMIDAEITYRMQ